MRSLQKRSFAGREHSVLSIVRIYSYSTRDLYLGSAPHCGIAIPKITFPMSISKAASPTKSVYGNAIGIVLTTKTISIATIIAAMTTRTIPTIITVMKIHLTMAIGIS